MNIKPFQQYLTETIKQSPRTVSEHLLNLNRFTNWATAQGHTDTEHLHYTDILNYIHHLKTKPRQKPPFGGQGGLQLPTIQQRLNSLKKYYEYLKHIGIIEKNPCRKIQLKGKQHTVTQNVFTMNELEQLYADYTQANPEQHNNPLSPYIKQRNNVITGLLLLQGAISSEIQKLNVEDVKLDDGIIHLPKCRRGRSRELKLKAKQIIHLYQYITEARPKLIKQYETPTTMHPTNHIELLPPHRTSHIELPTHPRRYEKHLF